MKSNLRKYNTNVGAIPVILTNLLLSEDFEKKIGITLRSLRCRSSGSGNK
jgi:hypothetical protein